MGVLRNLEGRIERLVEGAFRGAFKAEVQPVELARRLAREMDAHRSASVSRTYVPNEYTVFLSPEDHDHFTGYEEGLKRELSQHLVEHARKRGYSLISRPRIVLERDRRLELGTFGITARMVDAALPDATPSPPGAGETMVQRIDHPPPAADPVSLPRQHRALLLVGDRRYSLADLELVVGRSRECDITLDDAGVSRRHARVRRDAAGWTLADLGSTNGTRLAGVAISGEAPLSDGDKIEIGDTVLVFRLES